MISPIPVAESDVTHTIKTFFENHQSFSLPKKSILIPFDKRPQSIFFLSTGIVKQTAISQKGQELVLNLYKPGSFFPLMDAIAGIENHYSFECMSACTGWKAPVKDTVKFIQQNGDVSLALNVRLLKGLHGMLVKTEKLMEKDANTLLLQTLLTLGERLLLSTEFTHQELADLTGLSRETVTRELANLKETGQISIKDHVITLLM